MGEEGRDPGKGGLRVWESLVESGAGGIWLGISETCSSPTWKVSSAPLTWHQPLREPCVAQHTAYTAQEAHTPQLCLWGP